MITDPTVVPVVLLTVFTTVNAGAEVIVVVTVDGLLVTGEPIGGVPVAVAVLTTEPASTSAWVIVWVAVSVTVTVGLNVLIGLPATDAFASPTVTLVSVTLPVFLTANA